MRRLCAKLKTRIKLREYEILLWRLIKDVVALKTSHFDWNFASNEILRQTSRKFSCPSAGRFTSHWLSNQHGLLWSFCKCLDRLAGSNKFYIKENFMKIRHWKLLGRVHCNSCLEFRIIEPIWNCVLSGIRCDGLSINRLFKK